MKLRFRAWPKEVFNAIKDVRVVGLIVFCCIALLVSWSGVRVIQDNYILQQRISSLQQEIALQELENENLRLSNEYFKTDQFLELQARRQFGLAAPGETVVLVPKRVALDRTADLPSIDEQLASEPSTIKPSQQLNLELWLQFFFRNDLRNKEG
jgi:cell division protein FtsB